MRNQVFVCIAVAASTLDLACSVAARSTPGVSETAPVIAADADATILNIDVTGLSLTPSFAPDVHDYYVRCAAGENALTVTVADSKRTQSASFHAVDDALIDVWEQYWIRCLPPDFPVITVTKNPSVGAPTSGWYLVDSPGYAMVLDTNGTPVWYSRGTSVVNVDSLAPNAISFMPNASTPFGTSIASRFEVHPLDGLAITTLMAVDAATDAHELRALPNGDHLLWTYPIREHVDLTGLQAFGSDSTIADCEIQEVSPSGALVWSWLATDHIDPKQESIEPASDMVNGASVIDIFHFNSIEVDSSGNLLLSSRHANALYYLERSTGYISWKLGGSTYNKDGAAIISIVDDSQTAFDMQHDARFLPNGDVTLFDDHGATPGVARGVEYTIDHEDNTAKVVFQFLGTAPSQYAGSFRRYPDGESVIGWGNIPTDPRVFTEINSDGEDVFDVSFGGQSSYRAVKVPLSALDVGMLRAATAK